MRKINIAVTHYGEDYATIEINGKELEVSLTEGSTIESLIKVIYNIAKAYEY